MNDEFGNVKRSGIKVLNLSREHRFFISDSLSYIVFPDSYFTLNPRLKLVKSPAANVANIELLQKQDISSDREKTNY